MAWTTATRASLVVMVACAAVSGAGVAAAPGRTYVRVRHLYSEIPHHHGHPPASHQHHHHHHHHHHYHHGDDSGEIAPYPPAGPPPPGAAGPPSEMLPPAEHLVDGYLPAEARPRHPPRPPAGEVIITEGRFTEPSNSLADDDYHPRPAAADYVPIDYPPGNAGSLPLDDYLPDAAPRPRANDTPPEMRPPLPPSPPPQQQQQKPHLAHLIPLPQQQQQQLPSPPRMHRVHPQQGR